MTSCSPGWIFGLHCVRHSMAIAERGDRPGWARSTSERDYHSDYSD